MSVCTSAQSRTARPSSSDHHRHGGGSNISSIARRAGFGGAASRVAIMLHDADRRVHARRIIDRVGTRRRAARHIRHGCLVKHKLGSHFVLVSWPDDSPSGLASVRGRSLPPYDRSSCSSPFRSPTYPSTIAHIVSIIPSATRRPCSSAPPAPRIPAASSARRLLGQVLGQPAWPADPADRRWPPSRRSPARLRRDPAPPPAASGHVRPNAIRFRKP